MPQGLQNFRRQYPQYNDLDDEELATRLYDAYYQDMDVADYRVEMGLPPMEEPVPDKPSLSQRLDDRLLAEDRNTVLQGSDMGQLASGDQDPEGLVMDGWEDAGRRGFMNNAFRLGAERGSSLLGNAIAGIVGRPGRALEERYPLGEVVFGTDWGPDDPADGKFRVRYMTPKELEQLKRETPVSDYLTDTAPTYYRSREFGAEDRNTPEEIKAAYESGDISDTLGAVFKFGIEQGIKSIPDMVAVMLSLPAYVGARAEEIGAERARNKGKDQDLQENLEALPFALGSALFERFGARKIADTFGKETVEELGQELLEEGLGAAAKRIAKKASGAGAAEAGTEAFQEGVLEYLGEKLGTDAPMSWEEALERGFFGALAGGTFGTTAGAGGATATEAVTAGNRLRDRWMGQEQPVQELDTGPAPDTDFDEEGNVVPREPTEEQPPPEPEPPGEQQPPPEPEGPGEQQPPPEPEGPGEQQPPPEPEPETEVPRGTEPEFANKPGKYPYMKLERLREAARLAAMKANAQQEYADAYLVAIRGQYSDQQFDELANSPDPQIKMGFRAGLDDVRDGRVPMPPPEPEAEPTQPPEAAPEDQYDVRADPRMKRDVYRIHLAGMAQDLTPGGDVSYIADDQGTITGRTSSVNPAWFQEMNADPLMKMSVRDVQKSVNKALQGQRLGVRQQRVVEYMLGVIWGDRTDKPSMDYARQQLEASRKRRLAAQVMEPGSGQFYDEGEYMAEMEAETRAAYELASEIRRLNPGLDPEIDRILETAPSLSAAMPHLEDLYYEQREAAAIAPGAETTEGGEPTAPAEGTDLLGDDTAQAQAIADEQRRKDAERNEGQDSVETGDAGDMFSEARKQGDLVEIAERQVTTEDVLEDPIRKPAGDLTEQQIDNAAQSAGLRNAGTYDSYPDYAQGYKKALTGFTAAEFYDYYDNANADIERGFRDAQDDIRADDVRTWDVNDRRQRQETDEDLEDRRSGTERRRDLERRAKVESMSRDQLVELLYTDPLTGLGNRRAFEEELEADPPQYIVSIDVDGLSGVNDNLGHDAGDALIRAVGNALEETGGEAYHISGDEFYLVGDNLADLQDAMEQVNGRLSRQVIELPDGRIQGINITHGIGETKADADSKMEAEKKAREAAGKRSPKGQLPPGAVMNASTPVQNMAWKPGGSYVGMIGRHGNLPMDATGGYQLGNGRTVRIPDKPVRRKNIMATMQRRLGNKIYEGRVKGKTRLGFYRRGIGEIRIKSHNDLEVAAHEVAHWIDDRHPWVSQLYQQYDQEMADVSYDSSKDYEGYAEFMRLWLTQEHEAMAAAPGFYDAWMQALEEHPGMREVLFDVQEGMHAWHLQGARMRLRDRYGRQDVSLRDRARDIIYRAEERLIQKVFDGFRTFKVAERAIRGVDDPRYLQARYSGHASFQLSRGLHGIMQAVMDRGTINWDMETGDIVFTGKSLSDIFDPVSDRMMEMQQYMVARRAQELMAQGRENLIRQDEIEAGLQYGRDDPVLEEVFDEWLAFNDRMMDFYQDSGIISGESRERIQEINQNYVPFNRVVETLRGEKPSSQSSHPFMRLKGGTQNIDDIFESIVGNTTHLVHMSLVNRAKTNFYNMIQEADNQTAALYAVPIGKDVKPSFVDKEQMIKALVESLGLDMRWYNMAKTGVVQSEQEIQMLQLIDFMASNLEEYTLFWQFGLDPKGNVDFYYDQGNKRFYEIGDPLMMESIGHIGPRAHNLAANVLGGFANVLRRGVTLTPTFQAKNFIRDTMNAFTLSKGQIVPAVSAIQSLGQRLYNDEHYWEYMANGGGFAAMAEADGIAPDRILDTRNKLIRAYDQTLSAAEYANRIAEFKALRKKGWTMRDAALAGREISSDFAMRGSSEILRWFTLSIPFLNARLQGLYRNGRELMRMDQGRAQFVGATAFSYAMRSLIALTVPTLILYTLNRDDERYQELPDWIRDLSWIFFTGPGEDDYLILPKPFETGMIWGTLPERMFEYMEEGDDKELVESMLWMLTETFNLNWVPQAFQPWYDLQKNKSFTGAPIIPDYLKGVEVEEQYKAYTSDAMIALGRELGISPIKAEYLMRGYFGTLGTYALGTADYLVGDIAGGGEQPTKAWEDNLLVSPFVNDGPLKRTHSEEKLYDMLRQSRTVVDTVRLIAKRDPDRLEGYVDIPEKTALQAANAALEGYAVQMRELNTAMDLVRADPELTGDEKREQIQELQRSKNAIARAAYQYINAESLQEMIDDAEQSLEQRRQAIGEQ